MSDGRYERLIGLGEEVVDRAIKAGVDVAEASVREGAHLSVKVRMRSPELIEEAGSKSVGLRVIKNQRVAVTYTSDLSPAGLSRFIEDAVALVELSQPDPFAMPPDASELSRRQDHPDLDLFDPSMSDLDAQEALRRASVGEAAALDYDARVTNSEGATFARAAGGSALVTSGGFRGYQEGTYASVVVSPVADDADGKKRSGYYWSGRRFLAELDSEQSVGQEAARRTLGKLGARKVPTQEVAVIFDADVARSLLGLFASCIGGGAIWRKSSYLVDRERTEVASSLVNIVDDPLIARGPGSRPFDGEGLSSRKNVVVKDGVLQTYLLDTYSARKLGKKSTASAARGAGGSPGVSTSNFILQAGTMSREDLIASTKKALYVTDMMGFGFNAVTGDFSRGASGFWVENGELTFPVSEVTISLNFDQLLKSIDAVANDLVLRTSTAAPTFRVRAMTLAGA